MTRAHRTADWSSPRWLADATAWVDERLADAGLGRVGQVEQPHLRPWATVLRVPVDGGSVWLKAPAPETAFEVPLYEILTRIAPDYVMTPIASNPAQGWVLLPDGGPTLRSDDVGPDAFAAAMAHYGAFQRLVAPAVDQMLAAGVVDMRPAVMPERFEAALEAAASDADVVRRAQALRGEFTDWCAQLAESALQPSLDHNDLHTANILSAGDHVRFYDWGDAVVAHPFATMLVPQQVIKYQWDADALAATRAAYLHGFADEAPGEDLAVTLDLAVTVASVARVLTWDRALRAARADGVPISPNWATAPAEALAGLVDRA